MKAWYRLEGQEAMERGKCLCHVRYKPPIIIYHSKISLDLEAVGRWRKILEIRDPRRKGLDAIFGNRVSQVLDGGGPKGALLAIDAYTILLQKAEELPQVGDMSGVVRAGHQNII